MHPLLLLARSCIGFRSHLLCSAKTLGQRARFWIPVRGRRHGGPAQGISIAEQYYPVPHYRPMRDIDFLVAEADLPTMESPLELGYFQP
jgi:hypothetical protein